MNNASPKLPGLDVTQMTRCGVVALSWAGWSESHASAGVQIFLDGFVAPDSGKGEARGSALAGADLASVIDLYRRKGTEFVQSLRGSFVLALWDERQEKLILATDSFGTRPIYYWTANRRIAFAPRIDSFAAAVEIPKVIEPNSLYFYLNHSFIPAPFTIYQGIRRLEPGHTLEWAKHRSNVRRYWDMAYDEDPSLSEAAAAESVRASLADSVRFALQDGASGSSTFGAFLSGGTDSSTLVGIRTTY